MERLKKLLKLKYPIIQAPAGGTVSNGLVIAVANAGACGGLPLTWTDPETAKAKIKEIQSKTEGSFYANFVLNFEPLALNVALEAGVRCIQFSWGMPDSTIVKQVRDASAILGIQVTDANSARAAIDLGADYLVCQGVEAGGHVQASRSLEEALEQVLNVAEEIPVVASGGIATGKTMRKFIDLGASGVVMGSRFVATQQSGAHDIYKDLLVDSKAQDTIHTICMNKGWEAAAHRVLRNSTTHMWEAAGCPVIGQRPGELDVIAKNATGKNVERYGFSAPTLGATGDLEAMALYAGHSVDHITDIPTVNELIERVWADYNN